MQARVNSGFTDNNESSFKFGATNTNMREFLYRDNAEKIKEGKVIRCVYRSGLYSVVEDPLRLEDAAERNEYNKNQIQRQGDERLFALPTYYYPTDYRNCPHCGDLIRQRGLGAHQRSLRCYAARAEIQAYLDGYVFSPIQYNSLTSPFCRRYPAGLDIGRGAAGAIRQKVFWEKEWAKLWVAHLSDGLAEPEDAPDVKLSGKYNYKKKALKPENLRIQIPRAEYLDLFREMADAKRKRATRRYKDAINTLILQTELAK